MRVKERSNSECIKLNNLRIKRNTNNNPKLIHESGKIVVKNQSV